MKHRSRDARSHGKRMLLLGGNLGLTSALAKGRCSSLPLLTILMRIAAELLAARILPWMLDAVRAECGGRALEDLGGQPPGTDAPGAPPATTSHTGQDPCTDAPSAWLLAEGDAVRPADVAREVEDAVQGPECFGIASPPRPTKAAIAHSRTPEDGDRKIVASGAVEAHRACHNSRKSNGRHRGRRRRIVKSAKLPPSCPAVTPTQSILLSLHGGVGRVATAVRRRGW